MDQELQPSFVNNHGGITSEGFAKALGAIVENPIKMIMVSLLAREGQMTFGHMYRSVLTAQGETPGWEIRRPLSQNHLENLAKNNIVKISGIESGKRYTATITDLGNIACTSAAAVLMDFELGNERPSQFFLGRQNAASTAVNIYNRIFESPCPLGVHEISAPDEKPRRTSATIDDLRDAGILQDAPRIGNRTQLVIAPEYSSSLFPLTKALLQVRDNPDFRQEMHKRALEIVTQPDLVMRLAKKAFHYSQPANSKTNEEWQRIIASKLPKDGADMRSLYKEVNSEHPLRYETFRRILQNEEMFTIENGRKAPTHNRVISWVNLA